MRAITSGVKDVGGLLGVRFCFLLVIVFFCAIDRSSTIDATTRRTPDALSFRQRKTLTNEQRRSAVTIELRGIDMKNRTAVEIAQREVRRKILEYLRRMKTTSASPTYSTTTASKITPVATVIDAATTIDPTTTTGSTTPRTTTATTAMTTTPTTTASVTTITTSSTTTTFTPATTPTTTVSTPPTTSMTTTAAPTTTPATSVVEATTQTLTTAPITSVTRQAVATVPSVLSPNRKRRRRNSGGNSDTLTDDDLHFVGNDHEFDENGQLRISIFIDKEGFGDLDLGELLHEAANSLSKSGEFEAAPRIAVNIYKGLPKELSPAETSQLGLNFWLPVLLASSALFLIFIFIFVRYWSSRSKKKTGGALDQEKFIPVLMS